MGMCVLYGLNYTYDDGRDVLHFDVKSDKYKYNSSLNGNKFSIDVSTNNQFMGCEIFNTTKLFSVNKFILSKYKFIIKLKVTVDVIKLHLYCKDSDTGELVYNFDGNLLNTVDVELGEYEYYS